VLGRGGRAHLTSLAHAASLELEHP
jgi:hypothetical protein